MSQSLLLPASWLAPGGLEADEALEGQARPRTRAECPGVDADGRRWCPWVGCRYHCAVHIREDTGEIQTWAPERDVGKPQSVQARWRKRDAEAEAQGDAVEAIDQLVERYGSPCALDWAETATSGFPLTEIGERLGCGEWSANQVWGEAIREVSEAVDAPLDEVLLALARLATSLKD